jgi:5-carboxymethyl-2-hydroxymuconate isomerase
MPHITVEYSSNLDPRISMREVIEGIHAAVVADGAFEKGGVRTRAISQDLYVVADGDPKNSFIHVDMRIAPGRSAETRQRVAQSILDVLRERTKEIMKQYGLGISIEIREIDQTASLKLNNLHERLKAKS